MRFNNVAKSVLIGVGSAAVVLALTGAAAGSGVGAVFNLGKTNRVSATSSLTGSTGHSMLSVTNSGRGPALSLQVRKGRAPLSVNSTTRVPNLNASLLGGLAASQFIQGGGQSRSFGFTMSTASNSTRNLLSVPGFGTLSASCASASGGSATVLFQTGSHSMDRFAVSVNTNSVSSVANSTLVSEQDYVLASTSANSVTGLWERMIIRYGTGSGSSQTTHLATVEIMVAAGAAACDFDAFASTSVRRP
jgi:hypothetical protein